MKVLKYTSGYRVAVCAIAAVCGLFVQSAAARTWFFDACGTVTVNGTPTSNVLVTAWGCEDQVVSNDVLFAQDISGGQISNNYHVVYDVELGEPGGSRAIDAYLVFSYGDCEPVVVDCETIHELNSIYRGKILLDVDILCFSDGGEARTPGFWQGGKGFRLVDDDDIAMLNECCLRNEDGSDADFANKQEFRAWLKKRNAANMAYQLSGHLAAMKLNIDEGFVDAGDMIYAPGCSESEGEYLSIGSVVDLADAALCEDGTTFSGDLDRDDQECLKDALDDANNNRNWVEL